MALITPDTISFTARISEDDLRRRMVKEVLAGINGLDENDKPVKGIVTKVTRGTHGGYVIEVTGPAPARIFLPREGDISG